MAYGLRQTRAGTLDRRVEWLAQTLIINEMSEVVEIYVSQGRVWAGARHEKVMELVGGGQISARKLTVFTVRYRVGYKERDRIVHDDGRVYRIMGVTELGRRELLELDTEFIEGGA